jgi:hypothetical protein
MNSMPSDSLDFYHEAKYRGVLPPELAGQLAALTQRVLELDARDSAYVDENNSLLEARIARLANMALVESNQRVDCYLIELNDPAAFRLRRRFFAFETDDPRNWRLEERDDPDLWYNVAVSELQARLDSWM